jgi:hypothetical protein
VVDTGNLAAAATGQKKRRHGNIEQGERVMSAEGTWKLSMQTPRGERKATLVLQSADGALVGQLTGEAGKSTHIFDGKADGKGVFFRAAITSPMPMTLQFTGTVDCDKISGTVSTGAFGLWSFTASRA